MVWQFWVLLSAALIVAALVWRFESSPGMVMSRAIRATAATQGCQQSVLVRGAVDDVLLINSTWIQGSEIINEPAQVLFAPGGTITPTSLSAIAAGTDLGQQVTVPPASSVSSSTTAKAVAPSFMRSYQQQLNAADSWLAGACLPYANPFQSGLRRDGLIAIEAQHDTLFRGQIVYHRGSYEPFAKAKVWEVVRPGSAGWAVEVVLPTTPPIASTAVFMLVDRIQHTGLAKAEDFAKLSPIDRLAAYQAAYKSLNDDANVILPSALGTNHI